MKRVELIQIIENFLHDLGDDEWAWNDFISSPKNPEKVEQVRLEILDLEEAYPPNKNGWCSELGLEKINMIVERLKKESW